jgi:hypothetical protein
MNWWGFFKNRMNLDEMAKKLLETARKLAPGAILKQIGGF